MERTLIFLLAIDNNYMPTQIVDNCRAGQGRLCGIVSCSRGNEWEVEEEQDTENVCKDLKRP